MDDMHLKEGTLLRGGTYRIMRFIKSGGFGCTYEARHVMLGRRVAIKEFFPKDFCNRDGTTAHVTVGTTSKRGLVDKLRRKFVEEARAISGLEHPGIVRVTDVFEENDTSYYVMDYIDGRSLAEIVDAEGPLPERRVLRYVRQVAGALACVHEGNRLHLDVKPANIMVDGKDNAILIDFGASKQYDEEAGENTSTLIGKTPGYAPLEQMGNDVVKFTPATDIYALGATMYKLLTGVTPLGANLIASGEELAPLPAGVSQGVRAAISAAMRTNKAMRPQGIRELLGMLGGDGDVTIIDVEPGGGGTNVGPVPEVPTGPGKGVETSTPQKERRPPRGVTIRNFAIVAVVVGLSIGFLAKIAGDGTSEEVPMANGERLEYQGETYTYSGPLNGNGNADGNGRGVYGTGTYEGAYVDGRREGEATFVTTDGRNKFEGTFKDDMYGEGRLTLDDGSYYEGTFRDGDPYTGTWYDGDGSVWARYVEGKQQ